MVDRLFHHAPCIALISVFPAKVHTFSNVMISVMLIMLMVLTMLVITNDSDS